MKFLKYIVILFITVSITGCSEDSSEPPFVLSVANLAGTYNIGSLNLNTKTTSVAEVAGVEVPFTVATSTSVGDTFQVAFVVNSNGTYTVSGEFRIVSTITPTAGNQVTNAEIIDFEDSGSYQLDTMNNTITLTSSIDGEFIQGTLNIIQFNETTFSLSQEVEEKIDAITTAVSTNISFTR